MLLEGAGAGVGGGRGSVWGWLASAHYLPYVLYLALVPGIVGHTGRWAGGQRQAGGGSGGGGARGGAHTPARVDTQACGCHPLCSAPPPLPPPPGFNGVLAHLSPLVISLACNMEPLIGSLLGWAARVVAPPGAWTWVGGALVLASTALVSVAQHRREARERERGLTSAALDRAFSMGGQDGEDAAAAEEEEERRGARPALAGG